MTAVHDIRTTDYHTAGEPFRIVVDGVPEVPGRTVLERREAAHGQPFDAVRRLLCHEPRGHADMYGCFLVPPDDDGASFGALFWHKDGFSTACGHGTIALGAWAVASGLVAAAPDGETDVVIDVPSGRVTARVRCVGGEVSAVTFRNIPSYVVARDVPVATAAGEVAVDVSYGGALYASVPAAALGLSVVPELVPALTAAGREIKQALSGSDAARHPSDPRLSGIYGTILYDVLPDTAQGPHQRNITVFADGEVDRSPCGSGTSARLALLAADGVLGAAPAAAAGVAPQPGQGHAPASRRVLTHDSVLGTRFLGTVVAEVEAEGRPAVVTEVEGTAFRTGEHRFLLDPRDRLGTGFVLR